MKSLLGTFTLTSSCCAAGIPLSVISKDKFISSTTEKSNSIKPLLSKCSDIKNLSEISLKNFDANMSCGKVESTSELGDENEGNTIFSAIGGGKTSGVGLINNSQAYCRNEDGDNDTEEGSDDKGSLGKEDDKSSSCSRTLYLELENKKWVKYEVKEDSQSNITKLCLSNCGIIPPNSSKESGTAVTSLVKENESTGHLVKFYKK